MVARNKVVLSGTMGSSEVWSTGFYFAAEFGVVLSGPETLTNWAEYIADGIEATMGGGLLGALSPEGSIDRIACYEYGDVGPVEAVGEVSASGIVLGQGSAKHPYTVAMVISSRGVLAGPSRRGRNYWPAVGADVSSDGVFTVPNPDITPAVRWAEMQEFIGNYPNDESPLLPQIYSPTLDALTPVSQYSWDSVPDTQRRRSDALTGFRYIQAFPPV